MFGAPLIVVSVVLVQKSYVEATLGCGGDEGRSTAVEERAAEGRRSLQTAAGQRGTTRGGGRTSRASRSWSAVVWRGGLPRKTSVGDNAEP